MCRMFCNFATKLVSIEKMKNEESQMIEGDGLIPFFDVTEDKMQHIIKVSGQAFFIDAGHDAIPIASNSRTSRCR